VHAVAKWRVSVVHLVTRSHGRGAEKVALALAAALSTAAAPHGVLALAPAFDGSCLDGLPALLDRPPLGAPALARAAVRLRRQLDRSAGAVRLVVAHGGSATIVAVAAAGLLRRGRRPAVVWQRILPFPSSVDRGVRRLAWRAVARRVDLAVALTDEIAAETRDLAPELPVVVIPNFRDRRRFAGIDRVSARRELLTQIEPTPAESATTEAAEPRLVGLVGHLIEQKQPLDAVAAFAELRARGLHVELVIAGDGPLGARVDAEAERLGLTESVHRLGQVADVAPLLAALDVLILTSRAEGVPGILIEAQMCGLPVVSYPVGGVATVIDSGRTGIIVADPTPGAVADAVATLLGDDEMLAAMGERALEDSAQFDTASAVSRYKQHFAVLVPVAE
jgi:glycosyltransferase involved in cell wall biosynthesis